MKSANGTGEPPRKYRVTTYVRWRTVPNLMGKLMAFVEFLFRSEGSLNQHLKLKHPEYYRQQM
jgi:hypothetical protein